MRVARAIVATVADTPGGTGGTGDTVVIRIDDSLRPHELARMSRLELEQKILNLLSEIS